MKTEATRKRCPKCGYKIRGANHENGQHHKSGSGGKGVK